MKKPELMTKDQTRFRRSKAFVISMVGEFAETCRSKQVYHFLLCNKILLPFFCMFLKARHIYASQCYKLYQTITDLFSFFGFECFLIFCL